MKTIKADFTTQDALALLDKALFALSSIPSQSTGDGECGTTSALAAEIKELFDGREDERETKHN